MQAGGYRFESDILHIMNRRGFIGSLAVFLAAPKIVPTLPASIETVMIYCPYIPITYLNIEDMLMAQMTREIQQEVDREVIGRMVAAYTG